MARHVAKRYDGLPEFRKEVGACNEWRRPDFRIFVEQAMPPARIAPEEIAGYLPPDGLVWLSSATAESGLFRQGLAGRDLSALRFTGVFLPGSPIVADSADVVADLLAELLPGRTAAEIEDDANRRAAAAGAGDAAGVAPVAGLREALSALKDMGLRLGVGTHDSEEAARVQAKGLGVDDLFDFYAGYDSGHGLKPGPGMPLAFAAAVGAPPKDMVMVGDSVHDLGAGRAAGCAASVGVLTGPATEAELKAEADVILPSIADLPDYLRRAFPPS